MRIGWVFGVFGFFAASYFVVLRVDGFFGGFWDFCCSILCRSASWGGVFTASYFVVLRIGGIFWVFAVSYFVLRIGGFFAVFYFVVLRVGGVLLLHINPPPLRMTTMKQQKKKKTQKSHQFSKR